MPLAEVADAFRALLEKVPLAMVVVAETAAQEVPVVRPGLAQETKEASVPLPKEVLERQTHATMSVPAVEVEVDDTGEVEVVAIVLLPAPWVVAVVAADQACPPPDLPVLLETSTAQAPLASLLSVVSHFK